MGANPILIVSAFSPPPRINLIKNLIIIRVNKLLTIGIITQWFQNFHSLRAFNHIMCNLLVVAVPHDFSDFQFVDFA